MANRSLIAVIDDDQSLRESLESLLRSVGFAVRVFASAEEFLTWDQLRNTNCLILDVMLPRMNGIELHRRLVASHCGMAVIFITARQSDEATRSRALRNGAVDYLIKPFTEDELLNAIRSALASK